MGWGGVGNHLKSNIHYERDAIKTQGTKKGHFHQKHPGKSSFRRGQRTQSEETIAKPPGKSTSDTSEKDVSSHGKLLKC